jgi:hypothetical protein
MPLLASDAIAIARTVTDQDVAGQVTDVQLLGLLKPIYMRFRRRLAMQLPTLYTKVSASFTLASSLQDIAAIPVTDFERVRLVERQVAGGSWSPVGVANPIQPDAIPYDTDYAFLERGGFLDFFPSTSVAGLVFRLKYLSKPAALTAVGDTIDVPDGGEEVLGELLAAKIRSRFEEQQVHLNEATRLWGDMVNDLRARYGLHPEGLPIAEVQ